MLGLYYLEEFHAVHIRHANIEKHKIKPLPGQKTEGLLPVRGRPGRDSPRLKCPLYGLSYYGLIVHNEYFSFVLHLFYS